MKISDIVYWSDSVHIQKLLQSKFSLLQSSGVLLTLKQKIPYGTQLYAEHANTRGLFNVYHSAKKGFSFVDCASNNASGAAIAILSGKSLSAHTMKADVSEESFQCWIGSDESGKGDLFGPLVVASFLCKKEMERDLRGIGVDDSKKLTSLEIRRIGRTLCEQYHNTIAVKVFHNELYNKEYQHFNNLNLLLAKAHAERIIELVNNHEGIPIDGIIVDKFARSDLVEKELATITIPLIQRTGGESNVGVAAASVIARYTFEKSMDALSNECGYALPYGAGESVKQLAARIYRERGATFLSRIVKVHFKTFAEICTLH